MAKRISVKCNETGQVFPSMSFAANYFHWSRKTMSKLIEEGRSKNGYSFTKLEEHNDYYMLSMEGIEPEKFMDIPGYEGLYQISNFGRVIGIKFGNRLKKTTKNKQGQYIVVLSKNSIPTCYNINYLMKLTWFSGRKQTNNFHSSKSKEIRCIDDNIIFKSIKECALNYRWDYSAFRKSLSATGEYRGKHFEIIQK